MFRRLIVNRPIRHYSNTTHYQLPTKWSKKTEEFGNNITKTFDENSSKMFEAGIDRAIDAITIANKKLAQYNIKETMTTVTLNVGIVQITFTSKMKNDE